MLAFTTAVFVQLFHQIAKPQIGIALGGRSYGLRHHLLEQLHTPGEILVHQWMTSIFSISTVSGSNGISVCLLCFWPLSSAVNIPLGAMRSKSVHSVR